MGFCGRQSLEGEYTQELERLYLVLALETMLDKDRALIQVVLRLF